VKHVPAGRTMRNIYLTPDQTRMIATSAADKKLVVINVRTEQVEFEIPLSGAPGEVAIESDRNLVIERLFVQIAGGFEVIDYKARKTSGKVALPGGSQGRGFVVSPDHKSLWASGVIFSLSDLKHVGSYSGGPVAFAPEGRRAFVSDPDEDSVSVIDASSYKELARIPVGKKPGTIVASN
jgi:YVTN family beta-propeller protein